MLSLIILQVIALKMLSSVVAFLMLQVIALKCYHLIAIFTYSNFNAVSDGIKNAIFLYNTYNHFLLVMATNVRVNIRSCCTCISFFSVLKYWYLHCWDTRIERQKLVSINCLCLWKYCILSMPLSNIKHREAKYNTV